MSTSIRILILVLAAAAAGWAGYRHGVSTTNSSWRAQQLEVERLANAARAHNEETGRQSVAQAHTEKLAQEERYAQLEERYRELRGKVPLVAQRRQPVDAAPPPAPSDAEAPPVSVAGVGRFELTGAAVWMWNSALAGHPDVPGDSCGADGAGGAPDPSCAQGAGLELDDAWDNHTVNAQACARNLARYERLKDHLRKLQR